MKVCVVGGGLSGLMAGKKLAENGFDVKIFESEERLGGLAKTFDIDGYKIPIFYHHIFKQDKTTLGLLNEFGIGTLKFKKINMGIYTDKKIYKISKTSALSWDFLSLSDKMKFGLLYLKTKLRKDWEKIEGLNADEWLEKTVGKNVKEKIFRNLMKEKYGLDLKRISASELAERLGENEAQGKFTYPKKGLQKMLNGLRKSVEKNDGIVKAKSPVEKIDLNKNEIISKRKEKFDIVINTAPVPVFLKITKGLPTDYRKKLGKIKYCKNICVDVGLEGHLSDYYWINCFNQNFGGIIEHTNLADVYPFKMAWLWKYAPSERLWKMKDGKIEKLFTSNLKKIFPRVKVKWVKTFKSEYASPLYDVDYRKHMPHYTTPIKNLFFSGVAVTYPKIRNMNTALESGVKTAEIIIEKYGERK